LEMLITIVLDKLEHLPSMMVITQLLWPPAPTHPQTERERSLSSQGSSTDKEDPTHFDALCLIELADWPSGVMQSSTMDVLLHTDPLLAIFCTFSELNGLAMSAALLVMPFDVLATSVGEHVCAAGAQLVLMPWFPSAQASTAPQRRAQSPLLWPIAACLMHSSVWTNLLQPTPLHTHGAPLHFFIWTPLHPPPIQSGSQHKHGQASELWQRAWWGSRQWRLRQ
jgi:hypothetical protein